MRNIMGKELQEATTREKTPKWYTDGHLFAYHFAQSNYITAGWNWLMGLLSKAAEPFLFASVLYSGYKLLPGVPHPAAGFDAAMFIMQQATLDIGGMGLMKLASQANKPKSSFPYVVGIILVGLMIVSVAISSLERLIDLGTFGTVIEALLLITRAIMAVLYGHAIHSLKEDNQHITGIVKTSDIYEWLSTHQRKVDTLSEQVGCLAGAQNTLSTHLQMMKEGLSSFTTTLSSLTEKLQAVDTQIRTLDTHIIQVEEQQNRQLTTITEVREHELAPLTQHITTTSQTILAACEMLAQMQDRQAEHFGQFAEVRTHELAPLTHQVTGISQAVITLGAVLAESQNRLAQVEQAQGQSFTELQRSVGTLVLRVRDEFRELTPLIQGISTQAALPQAGERGKTQGKGKQALAKQKSATVVIEGKIDTQDRQQTHALDRGETISLDTQADEENGQLDTQEGDGLDTRKIIKLDTRTKQAEITKYIVTFMEDQDREPTLSEIMEGRLPNAPFFKGCAKQTAVDARVDARKLRPAAQVSVEEASQAAGDR